MSIDHMTRTASAAGKRAKLWGAAGAAAVVLAGGATYAAVSNDTPAQPGAATPYDAASQWVDSIDRTHDNLYPKLDRYDRSGRLVPCPTDTPNCIGYYARSQELQNPWALHVYVQQAADGTWSVIGYDRVP